MAKRQFPFAAYPNGWFQVAWSDELAAGQVLPLEYFGQDLVLFRDAQGKASVLDAHCPHLGAHLGHGGKVENGNVVCPFHAWTFDGGGQCVQIGYAQKIPPKARIRCWPTVEANGLVMTWHHADGLPPQWEVPHLPECSAPLEGTQGTQGTSNEWTAYEKRRWTIKTRNQEMAENAVDSAHFHYLHGTSNMPKSSAVVDGHVLRVTSTTGMSTPRGGVDGTVSSNSYGFGFSYVRFTGIVDTLLVSSTTPIDEERVDHRFSFTIKKLIDKDVTQGVGKAFIREVTRQLEQDIPIWENKRYFDKPVLCDGDGPIGVFRRWSSQFYSTPGESAAAPSGSTATGG